jgi:hypothetical protein
MAATEVSAINLLLFVVDRAELRKDTLKLNYNAIASRCTGIRFFQMKPPDVVDIVAYLFGQIRSQARQRFIQRQNAFPLELILQEIGCGLHRHWAVSHGCRSQHRRSRRGVYRLQNGFELPPIELEFKRLTGDSLPFRIVARLADRLAREPFGGQYDCASKPIDRTWIGAVWRVSSDEAWSEFAAAPPVAEESDGFLSRAAEHITDNLDRVSWIDKVERRYRHMRLTRHTPHRYGVARRAECGIGFRRPNLAAPTPRLS